MAQTRRGGPGVGRPSGEICCIGTAGWPIANRDLEQRRPPTSQPDGKADHSGPRVTGLGRVPHDLPGTGCHREGIPLDENRSAGDAAQGENRSHAEEISLRHLPQPDPPDASAETYEGYRSAGALHLEGLLLGTDEIKKIRLANREVITTRSQTATDDPGDPRSMC